VALQWSQGPNKVKLGAFASRFSNYIALVATGEPAFVDDEGEAFPVYAFQGVRARLAGVEAEATWRAVDDAPRTLDLDARLDLVRGDNRTRSEPLPRIAPARLTLGATLAQGPWRLRAEAQHAARQSRVPADDVATPSWTLVNLSLDRRIEIAEVEALLFIKLNNVGDRLALNAATIRGVRELSPLPGRSMSAGMRVAF
jgi:iron complex outermembrane recepter protein